MTNRHQTTPTLKFAILKIEVPRLLNTPRLLPPHTDLLPPSILQNLATHIPTHLDIVFIIAVACAILP
jgi:hypothetical protein